MNACEMPGRWLRWRWIAGFWCIFALFDASQAMFMLRAEGKHGGEVRLFLTEFMTWLPWALSTPLILDLAHRQPLIPEPHVRRIAIHMFAMLQISLISQAWSAALQVAFNPWLNRKPPLFWPTWSTNLIYQALNCLAGYILILALTYLMDSRDRAARKTNEAARLAAELSAAQLAALRRQIEPHFMFNTLHSIAGLVREGRSRAAVNMIVSLSEFLRRAAEDSPCALVPLAEEVDYLRRYVEIEKIRFGERLRVKVDVPPDLLDDRVPGFFLQPLVENAIKHGIGKRAAGGSVRISAERLNGSLRVRVRNDGVALHENENKPRAGVGLANLRTRLQILHGDAADLRLLATGDSTVEVVVRLPLVNSE